MTALDPTVLRPSGSVLSAASKLYRVSFTHCLPLALIGALLSAAVGGYATARMGALASHLTALVGAIMNVDVNAQGGVIAAFGDVVARSQAILQSPGVWASYLGATLVTLACHGALIARQNALANSRADSVGGALLLALRRLPSILLAVAIFSVAGALGLLSLKLARASGVLAETALGLALPLLYTWLWGRLQLWLAVMFSDDVGAVLALSRSWRVIEGNWLRASSLTTVPYILIFVLSSTADLIASAATGRFKADAMAALIITQLLSLLSAVVTLPMLPAVWLALYEHVRQPGYRPSGAAPPSPWAAPKSSG